ncbi:hypothetical protein [Larkinella rosea]|uniref:Uncharacterized protein n=1 Tax=Larkinella rosea TaxID=2025312 RepID=A0A3P1C0R4_9BACT|nr:hypothetical protein [Larkinella rosea]RRB06838.1 hypothetical protein EHT25_03345 [Larkinella rosea]
MRPLFYQIIIFILILIILSILIFYNLPVSENNDTISSHHFVILTVITKEKDILNPENPEGTKFHLSPIKEVKSEEEEYKYQNEYKNITIHQFGKQVKVLESKIYIFNTYKEASIKSEELYSIALQQENQQVQPEILEYQEGNH